MAEFMKAPKENLPRRSPTTHLNIPVRPCVSNAVLAIGRGVGFAHPAPLAAYRNQPRGLGLYLLHVMPSSAYPFFRVYAAL